MPDTIKIELTWKTSKIVTHRRPPLQCRRYSQTTAISSQRPSPSGQNSQTIVALRSLQFRYLPLCVVRDQDLTSLAVVLLSMVVDNDYHRNCDDLRTTRSRRPYTAWKRQRDEGCGLQRNLNGIPTNCFVVSKFSTCWKFANERDGQFRPFAVYRIRQRQLTATYDDWREIQNCNSQLCVPCRYPLFVIVWARL